MEHEKTKSVSPLEQVEEESLSSDEEFMDSSEHLGSEAMCLEENAFSTLRQMMEA